MKLAVLLLAPALLVAEECEQSTLLQKNLADEGLLQELQDAHASAAFEGFVLHEEQPNHREVWAYRDYLPLELAKLPATAEAFAPRRTRKERANTMARELSSQDDRRLRMLCLTWNVGATLPQRGASLEAVLDEDPSPDICVIGFQETCQLSARRLLADGTEWKDWQKWADQSVKDAYEGELQLLESARLVGLLILVFVRRSIAQLVENCRATSLGIGVGGYGGNKGAVAVRFELGRSSFCFVNVHLAAGQENYIARCQNYGTILSKLQFDDDEDAMHSYTTTTTTDGLELPVPSFWGLRGRAMEEAVEAVPLSVAPKRLRSFPVPFNSHGSGGVNGEGNVEWSQSMGQFTFTHRLEGALPDRKEWTSDEVKVQLSSKSLQVTLNGTVYKQLTGDFAGEIFRFKSWWVVEDEVLIINLYKRQLGSWKHPFHGVNAGLFRRNAFPWRKLMEQQGAHHNDPGHGLGFDKAAPKEEELKEVPPGRPATEPGDLRPDGQVEEALPGGVFALPYENLVCSAHDMCLGITAQQDDLTVTIEVHFEFNRFEQMKVKYPLEALMAADVWPNAVCIFFRGDRMNPILWAEFDGQVEARSSNFRIGSSDPMRRRQAQGEMYSPCLLLRVSKIRQPGSWTKIFKEVWQHKLMVKELGPQGPQRFTGLPDGQTFLRAGYNLDDPDFWGNVDQYVASTMKQSGYTSAPKKLSVA